MYTEKHTKMRKFNLIDMRERIIPWLLLLLVGHYVLVQPLHANALQAVAQKTITQQTKQFWVNDYGAAGNGVTLTNWSATAGNSYVTTASFGSQTPPVVGQKIAIGGAGTADTLTLTGATNASPVVITFTQSAAVARQQYQVIISGATGNTAINGTVYLGAITNLGGGSYSAPIYSDCQIQTPIVGNGAYTASSATGQVPCTLVDTVASVAGTQVNLSTKTVACSVSSVQGTYGTDDTTAIIAAGTAAYTAAAKGIGATLMFPPGNYCVDGTATSAALTFPYGNIQISGSGRQATTITRMSDTQQIIQVASFYGLLSDVTIKNLSLQYGGTVIQRFFNSVALQLYGSTTNIISRCSIENVEAFNCQLAINLSNNVIDTQIRACFVHDCLADGISIYATTHGCMRISVIGNTAVNTGDDSYSNNTYNSSTAFTGATQALSLPASTHGVVFSGNTSINSGARGIASVGSDADTLIGNHIERSYLSGICISSTSAFGPVYNTIIRGNQITGSGQGSKCGPSATGPVAGIMISSDGTYHSDNILVDGNQIGPDLGTPSMGPAILFLCFTTSTTGVVNNHIVCNNKITGPFAAVTGSYHSALPTNIKGAAIYASNGINGSIHHNNITQAYGEGIFVDYAASGALKVDGNIIDSPNTSGATGVYAIDVEGGQAPDIVNNTVQNLPSGISTLYVNPQGSFSIINSFSSVTAGTALVGLTSTGSSPQTWTRPTGGGAAAVTQAAQPYLKFTTNAAVIIPTGNRNQDVVVTMASSLPNPTQLYVMLANSGADNNCYGVDLYTGNVVNLVNGTATITYAYGQLGSNPFAAASGDVIECILSNNQLNVYCTRSGTRSLISAAVVPSLYFGPYAGIFCTSTSGSPGINSFSVR